MFDTKKFGGTVSRLRKQADMTQSELAERLNLTRQAVSKYEVGDSFPDVSILVLMAEIFGVTLDELIRAGEPTRGEARILGNIAAGRGDAAAESVSDLAGLAPLLKPSALARLARGLAKDGIRISELVALAEYLSDDAAAALLETADYGALDGGLLEKLMPFLDANSKEIVFQKILGGETDWRMLRALLPHAEYMISQIEAAVMDGALPGEALEILREYFEKKR